MCKLTKVYKYVIGNGSPSQPAFWMRIRQANSQKPRISSTKLWGKHKKRCSYWLQTVINIQRLQCLIIHQQMDNICCVFTYSNNLSLGDAGSDAPHEQGEGFVQRPWSGGVIFGFLLFFLLFFRVLLRFLFCRKKRRMLKSVLKFNAACCELDPSPSPSSSSSSLSCTSSFFSGLSEHSELESESDSLSEALASSSLSPLRFLFLLAWRLKGRRGGFVYVVVARTSILSDLSNTYLLGFRDLFSYSFFLCLLLHVQSISCSLSVNAGWVTLLLRHNSPSLPQLYVIAIVCWQQKTIHTFSAFSFSPAGLRSLSTVFRSSLLWGSPPPGADVDFSLSSSSSGGMSKMRRSWSVPPSIFITAEGKTKPLDHFFWVGKLGRNHEEGNTDEWRWEVYLRMILKWKIHTEASWGRKQERKIKRMSVFYKLPFKASPASSTLMMAGVCSMSRETLSNQPFSSRKIKTFSRLQSPLWASALSRLASSGWYLDLNLRSG